ncbi:hypothetical protein [Pseudoalteromonas sp. 1181_04]|uniref:hypothetical protein n=1 Tax=Pseudoalteromonas sp. 1181_04 TaxID=2604450 RepID=UPI0040634115
MSKETFYKGAQGNLSLHVVTIALATLAADSSVVATDNLPIGTQITGVRIVNAALGADTEVTVQIADREGNSTDLAVFDTVAAGNGSAFIKPIYIGDEGPSDLVIENSGTGAATGEVTIQLEYRFKGY